jgi:hypothetical protein
LSGNELDINSWGWVLVDFGNYALEIIGDGWETGLEYFGEFMRAFGVPNLNTDNTDFSSNADLSAGKGGDSANSNLNIGGGNTTTSDSNMATDPAYTSTAFFLSAFGASLTALFITLIMATKGLFTLALSTAFSPILSVFSVGGSTFCSVFY